MRRCAMIKDLLQKIADRYKVTLTYGENAAEFTGFTGKDKFELRFQKVEIRMEIEAELEKMGIDYKTISSFSPEKITVQWEEIK
jgi:hypothetical protein